jgi:hypothetical protein
MAPAQRARHDRRRSVSCKESLVDVVGVVLVDMPRMLREIVREQIDEASDMEVAAEVADAGGLDEALRTRHVDFVVAGSDSVGRADVGRLLDERPKLKVLTIDGDGRDAVLYELRPRRTRLGEISPDGLLRALRRGTA